MIKDTVLPATRNIQRQSDQQTTISDSLEADMDTRPAVPAAS